MQHTKSVRYHGVVQTLVRMRMGVHKENQTLENQTFGKKLHEKYKMNKIT